MLNEQELLTAIADIVRQSRRKRQYTLDKLAEKSEIDYSTVSLIENGKQNPKITTLYKILYSLDIDLIELISDKNLEIEDEKLAALNRLEKLDLETLKNLCQFLDSFTISKL